MEAAQTYPPRQALTEAGSFGVSYSPDLRRSSDAACLAAGLLPAFPRGSPHDLARTWRVGPRLVAVNESLLAKHFEYVGEPIRVALLSEPGPLVIRCQSPLIAVGSCRSCKHRNERDTYPRWGETSELEAFYLGSCILLPKLPADLRVRRRECE